MNNKRCLIIGDGNFTFSLSFSQKFSSEKWLIIATSFEKREEVIERFEAGKTIAALSDTAAKSSANHDVHIMYEIDGTKLDQIPFLAQEPFQQIIFNFPHCGGKSNIKRNRTLLQQFFISSSKILDATVGEIWVTLCRGQGGTPADDVSRGLNNTWKIVEQAAEGGLMLSQVVPFIASDWPGYSQTGYRGLSKGFMVEGALTHVFTAPQIDRNIWNQTHGTLPATTAHSMAQLSSHHHDSIGCLYCMSGSIMEGGTSYDKESISEMILHAHPELQPYEPFQYPIFQQQWHPVFKTRELLMSVIKKLFTSEQLFGAGVKCTINDITSNKNTIILHRFSSKCLSHDVVSADSGSLFILDGTNKHLTTTKLAFESNLVQRLSTINAVALESFSSGTADSNVHCYTVTAPCIRRIPLSTTGTSYKPLVSHQLMVCMASKIDTDCFSKALIDGLRQEFLGEVNPSIISSNRVTSLDHNRIVFTHHGAGVESSTEIASCYSFCESVFEADTSQWFSCVFELDNLAMIKYGIPDIRFLWSRDRRFYDQFNNGPYTHFKSFNLYPPVYDHDVSFWVSPTTAIGTKHDPVLADDSDPVPAIPAYHDKAIVSSVETKLTTLVRECCGMMVVSLRLIDVYPMLGKWVESPSTTTCSNDIASASACSSTTDKISFCYRLTYMSCDSPLSFTDTKRIQDRLRERIATVPGWKLR